jgi:hypothetical protein
MADIKFSCKHCGQHISIDESASGYAVTCPACRGGVMVPPRPTAPPLPAAPRRAALPPPAPLPPLAPQKASVRWPWWAGGVALCVLIGGLGIWLLSGGKSGDAGPSSSPARQQAGAPKTKRTTASSPSTGESAGAAAAVETDNKAAEMKWQKDWKEFMQEVGTFLQRPGVTGDDFKATFGREVNWSGKVRSIDRPAPKEEHPKIFIEMSPSDHETAKVGLLMFTLIIHPREEEWPALESLKVGAEIDFRTQPVSVASIPGKAASRGEGYFIFVHTEGLKVGQAAASSASAGDRVADRAVNPKSSSVPTQDKTLGANSAPQPSETSTTDPGTGPSWQKDWKAFGQEMTGLFKRPEVTWRDTTKVFGGKKVRWTGLVDEISFPGNAAAEGKLVMKMPELSILISDKYQYKRENLALSPAQDEWSTWQSVKKGDQVTFESIFEDSAYPPNCPILAGILNGNALLTSYGPRKLSEFRADVEKMDPKAKVIIMLGLAGAKCVGKK